MKVLDSKKIDGANHSRITFIRVEPIDLKITIANIVSSLSDLSWISRFDLDYMKEAFTARALPTIIDITEKLTASSPDTVSSTAGEYVVSELSRGAIIQELEYLSVPLAELYNKQKCGNPGFDFHTQSERETLIFGEAKYLSTGNAYGKGLRQVNDFIANKKDLKDIPDLRDFFSSNALEKARQGEKGFAIGFSATAIPSDILIDNIIQNEDYKSLLAYEELVLVAVNI